MPFKSKAQRRKFAQLLVEGKISDEAYEEWNRSTGRKELPERLHPKTAASRSARMRPKATGKKASVGRRRKASTAARAKRRG